jgi:hypothetical protein
MTEPVDNAINPKMINAGTVNHPSTLTKSNRDKEPPIIVPIRIDFRPQRSLKGPLVNVPTTPASDTIENESPAIHKLACLAVIKVGKYIVAGTKRNIRNKIYPPKGKNTFYVCDFVKLFNNIQPSRPDP